MAKYFLLFLLFGFACLVSLAHGMGEFGVVHAGDTPDAGRVDTLWRFIGRVPEASEVKVRVGTDSLRPAHRALWGEKLPQFDFSPFGILPRRAREEEKWRNIPADCRIDWQRKREHPLMDFLGDVSTFFNTFDTTYVQRDRYEMQAQLYNIQFFQLIRLSGADGEGNTQVLRFAPAHTFRIGPYVTWRGLSLGYAFGVVPDRYGSRATEWTLAAYNSKVGADFSYVESHGNFNLLSADGIEGVERSSVRDVRFPAMRTRTVAVNVYHVFNYRHFSYPAAFSLSTVQLRSAGTWLAGLRYDNQMLRFDAERTETLFRAISPGAKLNEALRIDKIDYWQLGLSMGYAYNWVPGRGWLISASAAPSLGYKAQKGQDFSTRTLWRNIENFSFDCIFRLGIVHTDGRYYVGASAVSYLYDYSHERFRLRNSIYYVKLYLGINFRRLPRFRGERKR